MKCLDIYQIRTHTAPVVQDYTTVEKKISEDLTKWRDMSCAWIGRDNIVKMSVVPKLIYIFSEIPIDENHINLHLCGKGMKREYPKLFSKEKVTIRDLTTQF